MGRCRTRDLPRTRTGQRGCVFIQKHSAGGERRTAISSGVLQRRQSGKLRNTKRRGVFRCGCKPLGRADYEYSHYFAAVAIRIKADLLSAKVATVSHNAFSGQLAQWVPLLLQKEDVNFRRGRAIP